MPNATLPRHPGHSPARGLTLVELILVVLLLGTGLAIAVPNWLHSASEARVARHQALLDSVRAAVQVTHAAAQVRNQDGPSGEVEIAGSRVSTVYGYPAATVAGIVTATGLDPESDRVRFEQGGAGPGRTLVVALADAPGLCAVAYTVPEQAEMAPKVESRVTEAGKGRGC
jgi:type II secretory pathway pseudopilin PulG